MEKLHQRIIKLNIRYPHFKKGFMKTIYSVVLFSLLVNMASCQNTGANGSPVTNAQQSIKSTIPVDEFEKKLSTMPGAQLVDVRTPEEYAKGHLKNSVNIDIRSGDFADKINKLDKSKPVLVYCLSGGRSSAAASKMQDMGFSEIYNMEGGIMKWESAGKPVEQGAGAVNKPGITQDAFNKMISGNKYVLVDYYAPWCEPCKKMAPYLESLSVKKKDKLSLVKIDADDNKEFLKQKGIEGIPYLELYLDGKLVWQHSGFIEEDKLLKETKL